MTGLPAAGAATPLDRVPRPTVPPAAGATPPHRPTYSPPAFETPAPKKFTPPEGLPLYLGIGGAVLLLLIVLVLVL